MAPKVNLDSEVRIPPPLPDSTNNFYVITVEASHSSEEDENSDDDPTAQYRIFTGDVLKQVRRDIADAVVPTWVERPPADFGEASHGSLKADQWRTVCTIYLVLTLVRLWGHGKATDQQRTVLQNFVHLVVAVDAATRRSMSTARAELFDKHMELYVKGLRELYDHELVPNHHLALHLKECLLLFGPVHGWWAFPFERFNGLLANLNTNSRTSAYYQCM